MIEQLILAAIILKIIEPIVLGVICLLRSFNMAARTYNEVDRLPAMIKDTMGYLEKRQANDQSFTYELIIVDDGSPDKTTERSAFRTLLMYAFHFEVWLFAVKSIRDTQCGFKLFSRESVRKIFPQMHVERWAFDVERLYITEKLNIPIFEVDVNWQEIPGSKLDPFTASFQKGIDILAIWIRYLFGIWKIQYQNQ
ncbi:unnamed protein product [Rotaria magnacalcarata]|uniref:Dolichyl-phosphate beta-glucosyltransferase n=1 Tax=Rotaria magnacalcarata TaxID=392030 RepID=A0A816XCZ5_9BILA|nr:unnamed protein product [Rotaria magnacalcarata]